MTRKDLEELIDAEVSKVFADMVSKEPQPEPSPEGELSYPTRRMANLSEDELDEILFYGGTRPEDEN
jgi:hypothetical protein